MLRTKFLILLSSSIYLSYLPELKEDHSYTAHPNTVLVEYMGLASVADPVLVNFGSGSFLDIPSLF